MQQWSLRSASLVVGELWQWWIRAMVGVPGESSGWRLFLQDSMKTCVKSNERQTKPNHGLPTNA